MNMITHLINEVNAGRTMGNLKHSISVRDVWGCPLWLGAIQFLPETKLVLTDLRHRIRHS